MKCPNHSPHEQKKYDYFRERGGGICLRGKFYQSNLPPCSSKRYLHFLNGFGFTLKWQDRAFEPFSNDVYKIPLIINCKLHRFNQSQTMVDIYKVTDTIIKRYYIYIHIILKCLYFPEK